MTVERSWLINSEWLAYTRKDEDYLLAHFSDDYGLHAEGQDSLLPLVPDTRLQAIADAWNGLSAGYKIWVEPELATLLDALTEESVKE